MVGAFPLVAVSVPNPIEVAEGKPSLGIPKRYYQTGRLNLLSGVVTIHRKKCVLGLL